ncbi:MAG TPA: hypothetical protein VG433_04585, partial [Pirellulales bacterium]|nr:hypothetical protein [Pirellulales bacterium]
MADARLSRLPILLGALAKGTKCNMGRRWLWVGASRYRLTQPTGTAYAFRPSVVLKNVGCVERSET